MKNGMGTPAMVEELRAIEARERQLQEQITASKPEVAPILMPNLGEVYRRKVEKLK